MNSDLHSKPLEIIRTIRVKNNDLWMEILEIALEVAPERTKPILANIHLNDLDVADQFARLVNE